MSVENTNNDSGVTQEADAAAVNDSGKEMTLEEFLSNEANRAMYDAAVEKAVTEAMEQQKAEEDEARRQEGLSREEKMAEKEKALNEREARLQEGELKSEAVIMLANKGISARLAECFNYASRESYEKSSEAALAAFSEAVQAGVNDRLRGKNLPNAGGDKETAASTTINDLSKLIKDNQAKRR
ncbi:MAG: DUF4355 domain-containing protein [Acetatifactor sp.]